ADHAAFFSDGRFVVADWNSRAVRLWDAAGSSSTLIANIAKSNSGFIKVNVFPDGRIITSTGNVANVWNERGECLATLSGHAKTIMDIATIADDRIATASQDGTVKIWKDTGECLATLSGHSAGVLRVAALPDGRLVSASFDGTAKIWQPA